LRIVGVCLILAGYVQWFLPDLLIHGHSVVARLALTAAFMGTGLVLYLFASRGFRKEVHFDTHAKRIRMARVNASDHSMISHDFAMADIESLFVNRSAEQPKLASLDMRLKGSARKFSLMRGAPAEIENLHSQLSRDIKIALMLSQKAARPTRVKPVSKATAIRQASPMDAPVLTNVSLAAE